MMMHLFLSTLQIGTNDDLIYGMEDAAKGLIVDYGKANKGSLPEVRPPCRFGLHPCAD